MIWVLISSESRYPISRKKIKKTITDYLEQISLKDAEVSVAFVGGRKIRQLNKEWRNLDEETTVLTFGLEESRDKRGILRIGDIVICYPQARVLAQADNLLMDEAIDKLLIHGLKNILGNTKNANQFLSQIPTTKVL